MSQRGPWSVKGIDQRARDAAREAAREEGLTLGEYLNSLLLRDNATDTSDISRPYETPQPKPEAASSSLDRLTRRIEATEARSTLAITGIDQSVLGLLARLENAERGQSEMASGVDNMLEDIRSTHGALQEKVHELEEDESSKKNLEALKSLENALGKLASHVYEESELTQNEAEAVKSRIESGLGEVNDRLEGMETKVEDTLSDAARRVEKAVEQAELRSEGAARHLSDRFASLETGVAAKLVKIDDITGRVDSIEGDVSGALESMEGTLLRIQERLNRAETTTDAALKSLESTFDSLDRRIEHVAEHASPEAAVELRQQFERRFEGLAEEVRASVASTRTELAEEIENAAKSASPELFTRLEVSVQDVQHRLSISEERQSRAIENVGDQMHRISQGYDQRLQSVENRNDAAAAEAVREEVSKLSDTMETRLDSMEAREASAIEQMGSEMGKLADHMDARISDSEHVSAQAIEQVGEQVASVASRMQTRQDEAFKTFSSKLEESQIRHDSRLSDALSNVSQRLELMQEQASASLSPVQKAIASLATRLEAVEDFTAPPFVEANAADSLPDLPELPLNEPLFEDVAPPADHIELVAEEIEPIIDEIDPVSETFEPTGLNPELEIESTEAIEPADPELVTWPETDVFADEPADEVQIDTAHFETEEPASEAFEPGVASWDDIGREDNETAGTGEAAVSPDPDFYRDERDLNEAAGFSDDYSYETSSELEAQTEEVETASDTPEYTLDLPEELVEEVTADPISELEHWDDGRDEVRESDIFEAEELETEDPVNINAEDISVAGTEEAWSETETPDEAHNETQDYITRAREAALAAAGADAPPSKRGKKPKRTKDSSGGGKDGSGGSGNSKGPLIAMAAVLTVSTVGAGGYLYMRGKQAVPVQALNETPETLTAAVQEEDTGISTDIASLEMKPIDTAETAVTAPEPETTPEAVDAVESAELETELFEDAAPEVAPVELAGAEPEIVVASTPNVEVATAASLPPVPATPSITLEQAAEQGNPIAMFQLGTARLEAGDYAMGSNLIRNAAEAGAPAAQYRFAKLHEKGLGVPRDLTLARQWTERAAQGGNTKAMHDLAVFYAEGEGGPQSYAGAVEWFRKAAEFGIVDSQYNLAVLYEEGLGISPSLTEALFWFEIAARQGDAAAPAKVTDLRERVSLEAAQQAQRRASSWQAARTNGFANGRFGAQPWNDVEAARIADVQRRLNDLGYQAGSADGAMGPGTESAIRAFQSANGLTATGTVSDTLLQTLEARAATARG